MKEEILNQGVSLIRKIHRIESLVEGCAKIHLRVETNSYGPEFIDELSPEAQEAVEARLADIKQIMIDDFNNQCQLAKSEFDKL